MKLDFLILISSISTHKNKWHLPGFKILVFYFTYNMVTDIDTFKKI